MSKMGGYLFESDGVVGVDCSNYYLAELVEFIDHGNEMAEYERSCEGSCETPRWRREELGSNPYYRFHYAGEVPVLPVMHAFASFGSGVAA